MPISCKRRAEVKVPQAWMAVIGPGNAQKSAGALAGSGRSNDSGICCEARTLKSGPRSNDLSGVLMRYEFFSGVSQCKTNRPPSSWDRQGDRWMYVGQCWSKRQGKPAKGS